MTITCGGCDFGSSPSADPDVDGAKDWDTSMANAAGRAAEDGLGPTIPSEGTGIASWGDGSDGAAPTGGEVGPGPGGWAIGGAANGKSLGAGATDENCGTVEESIGTD